MMKKNVEKEAKILRAAVFGANDGIVTTFAVVAGVAGAGLSAKVILILGVANMVADGLSMGLGDYLGEKSERRLEDRSQGKYNRDKRAWLSGVTTIAAFITAGSFPLMPYFTQALGICSLCYVDQFKISILFTMVALFVVGSLRTFLTKGSWWKNGLEMLAIGSIAAIAAYVLGMWVEGITA
jgi:vacuolar iron transporter family protein